MMIKIKKNTICELSIALLFVLTSNLSRCFAVGLSIYIIVYSICKLIITKDDVLFIVQAFMLFYTITPLYYFAFDVYMSQYMAADINRYENLLAVFQMQVIFITVFLNIVPIKKTNKIYLSVSCFNDFFPWCIMLLWLIICIVLSDYKGIIEALANPYGLDAAGSYYFEYFLVFCTLGFAYANTARRKRIHFILSIVALIGAALTRRRLAMLMLMLLVYILYFKNKIKKKYLSIATVAMILVTLIIGNMRTHSGESIIVGIIKGFIPDTNKVMINNQTHVWYASEAIYKLIQEGIFDFHFRIRSFYGTFLNSFLTTGLTPEEALVNKYIIDHHLIGYPYNGGMIGVSTYLWLGYAGVILSAIILGTIIKNGFNSSKRGHVVASVLVLCTFPKWYTYNPRILFKFAFVATVAGIATKVLGTIGIIKGHG